MLGASLTRSSLGQAPSDRLALKPYWGKPTVRNFRGGGGDVGIMRSPVRATALPDRRRVLPHFPSDTLNSFAERNLLMKLPKNLGMLLLGIWLILTGLIPLLSLSFSGLGTLMAILAIAAGVLIVLNRQADMR